MHPHPTLNLYLEAELKEPFGLQKVLLASNQQHGSLQRSLVAQMVAHLGALRADLVDVLATSINNARVILELDKERERDA